MTEQQTAPLSRRERKKRETWNRILTAALKLFVERGYDQVRIEEICNDADISNATFFAYFPTKASLITGFGSALLHQVRNRLNEFDGASPDESLELLRVIYFDEWAGHRNWLQKVFVNTDSAEAAAIAAADSDLVDLVVEIIESGQKTKHFKTEFKPQLVAQCLVAGWRSVMVRFVEDGNADLMTENNREVLDIVLEGAQ